MPEIKRGLAPLPFRRYTQAAVETMHFKNNPNAQQAMANEADIVHRQNPLIEIAILDTSKLYPQYRNLYLWGAAAAHRALRLRATAQSTDLPVITPEQTARFQARVIPIIQRLSRHIEEPARNKQPIVATFEDLQAFLGRFREEDPEASDYLWQVLDGDEDTADAEMDILRETHPAYQGFSHVYLMMTHAGEAPTSHSQQGSL